MSPQYQVYSLPGTDPDQQVFTVSDGFVPAAQTNLSGNNQNFNLTAWMVGLADPGNYGQLDLYETPQGTAGPANADAEISANKTVSSDITLLDQHGSEVLLGETLMVPIANSMVYLRPLYASPTTNPQPQLQYVVGVLGKSVQIDTSLSAVLSDLLQTTVSLPSESGVSSTGTVPLAVAGLLQQAQTDYTNALAALKANNLGQFQTDINMMQQAITQAQQVIGAQVPDTVDHHHDDGATCEGDEGLEEAGDNDHDDLGFAHVDHVPLHHLGADEHRAEELRHHDLDDAGLGSAEDLRAARPLRGADRLRPVGLRSDCDSGCERGRCVP